MLPDVLLLPGLLCDDRLWAAQAAALAGVARCRTVDLAPYASIAAMAEAVLQDAPERFALAGFSMGGCVALEVVARAPGRVGRLALLGTSAHGAPSGVRAHLRAAIAGVEAGGLAAYLADAFPRYVAPARVHDAALWATFSAMGESLGPAAGARQMRALLDYPGFAGDPSRIACPTTLLCGREDRRTPVATHEELASAIPGATLVVVEGAGHFTPIEAPRAVAEALRGWLQL
jgi:pimeloyl-ACP methyl ester carboxylesterase